MGIVPEAKGELGFQSKVNGLRKKKSIRGNTINQDIVQVNMKIIKYSSKPIDQLLIVEKPEDVEKKEEK